MTDYQSVEGRGPVSRPAGASQEDTMSYLEHDTAHPRRIPDPAAIEFWAVDEPASASLAACGRCGVIIVDDDDPSGQSGRSDHERHHAELDELRARHAELAQLVVGPEQLPAEVVDSIDTARQQPTFSIFELDDHAQQVLRDALVWSDGMTRTVRLAVDMDTLKVKVGEGAWSPPIAEAVLRPIVEPRCRCGARLSDPVHVGAYVTGLAGHQFVEAV
jgi:hypothetical protein